MNSSVEKNRVFGNRFTMYVRTKEKKWDKGKILTSYIEASR